MTSPFLKEQLSYSTTLHEAIVSSWAQFKIKPIALASAGIKEDWDKMLEFKADYPTFPTIDALEDSLSTSHVLSRSSNLPTRILSCVNLHLPVPLSPQQLVYSLSEPRQGFPPAVPRKHYPVSPCQARLIRHLWQRLYTQESWRRGQEHNCSSDEAISEPGI